MKREDILEKIKAYERQKIEIDARIAMLRELLPEFDDDEKEEHNESFASIIDTIISKSRMTIEEWSNTIGYSSASICNWRNGSNIPYRKKWVDISIKLSELTNNEYTQKRIMEALRNGLGKEESGDN